MSKKYTNKYFMTRIKKLRLIVSHINGFRSMKQLLAQDEKSLDLSILIHGQEHTK